MSMVIDANSVEWRSVCPIASGLDVLGDKWSLVIVRDLFEHGTRTYSEFGESPEAISTNILAARLKWLSAIGIVEHVEPDRASRNNAYQLTSSGLALRPVLEELGKWSQTYLKEMHPEIVTIL
ncbi:MAG: transcriptional regulator [Actinobacteria bacterium]|jgi:DNA-binding HxlR family transcriptional regulator|nr:transcriptional regulator [Actinomycetota bacterium]